MIHDSKELLGFINIFLFTRNKNKLNNILEINI